MQNLNAKKIKYRFFKISINFFFINMYTNTKVFVIKNNTSLVLLSIWHTLISLFLGWWGTSFTKPFRSIRNTIEALHINLTGGIDFTNEMDDTNYDDKTNHTWNNLLRLTTDRITKDEVEIIIDVQELYENSFSKKYTDKNIDFIISNLEKVNIYNANKDDIRDVFDAIQSYERYTS